jgi:hypothetical protein
MKPDPQVKHAIIRFTRKVRTLPSNCWEWKGTQDVFTLDGRRTTARRAAYRLYIGAIPERAILSNFCTTEGCVNPQHLYLIQTERGPNSRGPEALKNEYLHAWLRRWHPKTGKCDDCGGERKTEYAFKRHPAPYTRRRLDYAELCRHCHVKLDQRLRAEARNAA